MSSSFSEYAAEAILAHAIGKTAWAMPTTYIALCTTLPTSASTGATIVEANYTGYAREATTSDWGATVAGTPSTISNSVAIVGSACTAGTSTIVGFAIVDSATVGAGNVIAWGSCASTVISTTQTPPTFVVGALELTLTAS